jgi:hypothetical protein
MRSAAPANGACFKEWILSEVRCIAIVRVFISQFCVEAFLSQDKQQGLMVGQFGGVLRDSENPLVEVCAFHASTRLGQES